MKNNKIANDIEDLYPLADIQKGMVYHSLIDPGKFIYYILSINYVKLKDFDAGIFKKTFELMIDKHNMLRTGFNMYDFEEPIQMVHKHIAPDIKHYDIAGLDSQEQQAYLRKLIVADKRKPFNINSGEVLWKVRTLNLGEDNICLIWISHHAVMDGWSSASLMTEVKNTYLRLIENPNYVPQKLKNTYKAFVIEQIIEKEKKENVEFWQRELEDYKRIAFPRFTPHENNHGTKNNITKNLDRELANKLKITAKRFDTSLKHLCFGAYVYMLNMLSYENDLVVGLISNSRPSCPDGDKIIGCFLNTIPVRIKIPSLLRWRDYIRLIEDKLLELKKYDKFSFLEIVKNIGEMQHGQNPILDTIFNYTDFHIYDQMITKTEIVNAPFQENLKDVSIEDTADNENNVDTADDYSDNVGGIGGTHTLFDCSITATGGELRVFFNFDTGSIDSYCVEALCRYFEKVLHKFAAGADDIIKKEDLLSDEEKQRILFEFNHTAVDYPQDKTIPQLFMEQTAKMPDFIAIVGNADVKEKKRKREEEKHQITYRQLNEESDRLAGVLIEKGVLADTIVGIMVKRSVEMIIGILGILKSGAAYLPLNPEQPQSRTHFMMKDSRAMLLAVANELEGEKVGRWEGEKVLLEEISKFPQKSFYLQRSSNLAYVIYTSGSTGTPKGVPVTHANFSPLIHWGYKHLGINEKDRVVQNLSYYFDWSVWEIFLTLTTGAALYIASGDILLDPDKYIDFLDYYRITVLHITPTHFQSLTHCGRNLSSLSLLCLGAEPLTYDLVKRSFRLIREKCRLFNMYGPTETTIISAALEIERMDDIHYITRSSVPIGRPVGNTILLVLDNYKNFCPVNIIGELYIGGTGVARGYLNNPELTENKFVKNYRSYRSYKTYINYKTGDLARWLPDSSIEFLGRIDQQVKIRGFRIELGEIEAQLSKYPGLKETVVLAQEEPGDKFLCAYIVSTRELVTAELREYLVKELPDYMIPSYFVQMEKIPLTPNGKLDRNALPKPGLKAGESYIAPRDKIEEKLVELWAGILGRDETHASQLKTSIGIDDNFFQLGGHSLKATILVSRIHKSLNIHLPLTEVFKHPTARGLAEYIKVKVEEKYESIEPVEKKEYYELSSAQKRLFFLRQLDPDGLAYNIPVIIPLPGNFQIEKLSDVFKKLIKRHESLRTSFHLLNNSPVQKVHDQVAFEIENKAAKNAKGREDVQHSAFVMQRIQHSIHSFIRPFDLSQAPLMRAGLLKNSDGSHILLVDIHHIITDGTSQEVLKQDFMSLYKGESLPSLRLQYKDFAQWQNSEKQKESIKRRREYWLNEFAGKIPVLGLPVDYQRPAVQSFEGNRIPFEIDKESTVVLKALTLKTGTTLYMLLLALYTVFLAKITGQEEIVIGSPIAGRRHADLEKIIGMFVNTLALRNYPAGEKKFTDFLQEVKEKTLKAFENQDYQYEDLVEHVIICGDTGRNPLFDTMFALQNMEIAEINIPGLKLSHYPYENKTAKFDLTLIANENKGRINFYLEYCSAIFKKETIERFIGYFKQIVTSVMKNSDTRIYDIEIIGEEEHKRLLTAIRNEEDKTFAIDDKDSRQFPASVEGAFDF